jgi:putative lipoprotein
MKTSPLRTTLALLGITITSCAIAPAGGGLTLDSLANTEWAATAIVGRSMVEAGKSTLRFSPDGRVNGSGGCNTYFGAAKLVDGTLALGPLASTKRLCVSDVQAQEDAFFQAMNRVVGMRMEGADLALTAADGAVLVRFMKTL